MFNAYLNQNWHPVIPICVNFANYCHRYLKYFEGDESTGYLSLVFSIAFSVSEYSRKKDLDTHSYFLSEWGDHYLDNGEFSKSQKRLRKALDISKKIDPKDYDDIGFRASRLGVAFGSARDYFEGAWYFNVAKKYLEHPHRSVLSWVNLQVNMAQNSYCSGDFDYALERLSEALEMSIGTSDVFCKIRYVSLNSSKRRHSFEVKANQV